MTTGMLCSISRTVASFVGNFGIGQALRRFVEDQQLGMKRKPHGDFEKALMTIRQRPRDLTRAAGKADAFKIGEAVFRTRVVCGKADILGGTQVGIDAGDLERIGDAASDALEGGELRDVVAFEVDRASTWRQPP
jgi:hypothetical protein